MINISVIGAGYVGLVSGACLAEFGFRVTCLDVDKEKIRNLKNGKIPIYEPGLQSIVEKGMQFGRLSFTTSYEETLRDCNVVFIAVGTPSREDGSADLSYVLNAAQSIAEHISEYTVIVDKSTVPVGTGRMLKQVINDKMCELGREVPFDVVSNPEFLREGSAVNDFMQPDRIVIGADSEQAFGVMRQVYRVLYMNNSPFVFCDVETAEIIKYASNAYLAARITFMNELSLLCDAVGADVTLVGRAMGQDARIGPKYLNAGPGYGGSCFPKDTRAILHTARDYGVNLSIIDSVIQANERQKVYMADKIETAMGDLNGKNICVLGLAFKPDTDDVREAPSITIIKELSARGAVPVVFDPISMKNTETYFAGSNIKYAGDEMEAIRGADALVIVTEWNQFRNLDMREALESMAGNYLFDLRNIYIRSEMEEIGFQYFGVGR